MTRKTTFISLIIGLVLFSLAVSANAASLPRLFELPTNTDLRRGDLVQFIGTLIRAALGLLGAILLLMIVYGGFVYATAAGSDDKVKKGRNILTYAIIGVVIISGAFIISNFIIQNVVR